MKIIDWIYGDFKFFNIKYVYSIITPDKAKRTLGANTGFFSITNGAKAKNTTNTGELKVIRMDSKLFLTLDLHNAVQSLINEYEIAQETIIFKKRGTVTKYAFKNQ